MYEQSWRLVLAERGAVGGRARGASRWRLCADRARARRRCRPARRRADALRRQRSCATASFGCATRSTGCGCTGAAGSRWAHWRASSCSPALVAVRFYALVGALAGRSRSSPRLPLAFFAGLQLLLWPLAVAEPERPLRRPARGRRALALVRRPAASIGLAPRAAAGQRWSASRRR